MTGGAGFIGTYLVDYLVKKGHSVKIIDKCEINNHLQKLKNKIEYIQEDILQKKILEKILNDVDGVFHQAALISVAKSNDRDMKTKYYDINVKGSENIFKFAKKLRLKVVYASSASVYGNTTKTPVKENNKKIPIGIYAKTKLECEKKALEYSKKGTKIVGLRYFNVYGQGQLSSSAGVITKFLNQIQSRENLTIHGNGFQQRDFVHVSDVVKANLLAMETENQNVFYNVGTQRSTSILELAKLILKISNLPLKINFNRNINTGIEKSQADIELIKKTMGWEPQIKLKNWLKYRLHDIL